MTSRYSCNGYNNTNPTVEVYGFSATGISALTDFEFTIGDAIINPGTLGKLGEIEISTMTVSGGYYDKGTY